MKCPRCGNSLAWEDGAFCAACMRYGKQLARLRQIAELSECAVERLAALQLIEKANAED